MGVVRSPGEDAGPDLLQPHLLRLLRLVEAADAVDGEFDGGDHLALDLIEGLVEIGFGGGDGIGRERRLVELAGEARQRLVALGPHGLDHRPHLLDIGREIGFGPLQQLRPRGGREAAKLDQSHRLGHRSAPWIMSLRSRSEMYRPLATSTAMPTQVQRSGKSPKSTKPTTTAMMISK